MTAAVISGPPGLGKSAARREPRTTRPRLGGMKIMLGGVLSGLTPYGRLIRVGAYGLLLLVVQRGVWRT
jgi:hypothetical protein